MYQLVQNKKRHIVWKVLGFLIVCAIIKEIITVRPEPVSKQLDDFANSVNKRCPMVMDSTTTLNNCLAVEGNRLHFNYTVSLNKEDVDSAAMVTAYKEQVINKLKTDPSTAILKKNNVALSASYYDKTGKYICKVSVEPGDLK